MGGQTSKLRDLFLFGQNFEVYLNFEEPSIGVSFGTILLYTRKGSVMKLGR